MERLPVSYVQVIIVLKLLRVAALFLQCVDGCADEAPLAKDIRLLPRWRDIFGVVLIPPTI